MSGRHLLTLLCLLVIPRLLPAQAPANPALDVRIAATVSTKPILLAAAKALKDSRGLNLGGSVQLTSQDAFILLATGSADIALITKNLTGDDRGLYPEADFVSTPVGAQVVAIGVSNDLWDAGVHSITRDNMRAIYEQKITDWKQLGGPAGKITFLNYPQKQGVWENFAEWLYGDSHRASYPQFRTIASSDDARANLEFGTGTIAIMGAASVDGERCHALAILSGTSPIDPTPANAATGAYPMVRPINAITIGRPGLATRTVTEFLTSPDGQALLKKAGSFGLDAVKPASDAGY